MGSFSEVTVIDAFGIRAYDLCGLPFICAVGSRSRRIAEVHCLLKWRAISEA